MTCIVLAFVIVHGEAARMIFIVVWHRAHSRPSAARASSRKNAFAQCKHSNKKRRPVGAPRALRGHFAAVLNRPLSNIIAPSSGRRWHFRANNIFIMPLGGKSPIGRPAWYAHVIIIFFISFTTAISGSISGHQCRCNTVRYSAFTRRRAGCLWPVLAELARIKTRRRRGRHGDPAGWRRDASYERRAHGK